MRWISNVLRALNPYRHRTWRECRGEVYTPMRFGTIWFWFRPIKSVRSMTTFLGFGVAWCLHDPPQMDHVKMEIIEFRRIGFFIFVPAEA